MAGALGVCLAASACGVLPVAADVPIPTQSPPADPTRCMAALLQGQLTADARWGIALRTPDGQVRQVVWPNGYSGAAANGTVILRDTEGRDVARTGDWVEVAGGELEDGAWIACSLDPVQPWSGPEGRASGGSG